MQTTAAVNLLDRRACGVGVAALLLLAGPSILVSFFGFVVAVVLAGGATGYLAGSVRRALPNGLVAGLLGGYLASVEFVLVMYVGSHVYPEKPPLSEVLPELFLEPLVLVGAVLLGVTHLLGAVGGGALGGWLKRA